MQLSDLDLDKTYSYADYLKWTFEDRLELIKGKIFKMTPAPASRHILAFIGRIICIFKREKQQSIPGTFRCAPSP
jgi:Uma2 family endonuclease